LGGEIRQIAKIEQRLKEAERLGFTKAIIPANDYASKKIKLIAIKNVQEITKLITDQL
jgi:DNA repair protein RadA/Sms